MTLNLKRITSSFILALTFAAPQLTHASDDEGFNDNFETVAKRSRSEGLGVNEASLAIKRPHSEVDLEGPWDFSLPYNKENKSVEPESLKTDSYFTMGSEKVNGLMKEVYQDYKVIGLILNACMRQDDSPFKRIGIHMTRKIVKEVARKDLLSERYNECEDDGGRYTHVSFNYDSSNAEYYDKYYKENMRESPDYIFSDPLLSIFIRFTPYLSKVGGSFKECSTKFYNQYLKRQGLKLTEISMYVVEMASFEYALIDDDWPIDTVANNCPNLEKLIFWGYDDYGYEIMPFDRIFQHCKKLKYLKTGFKDVQALKSIVNNAHRLETLELTYDGNWDSALFEGDEDRDFPESKLKNLKIYDEDSASMIYPMEMLTTFLKRNSNVEVLVKRYVDYWDHEPDFSTPKLNKLKKLKISSPNLGRLIEDMSPFMPNLEKFDLSYDFFYRGDGTPLPADIIKKWHKNCKNIKHINLKHRQLIFKKPELEMIKNTFGPQLVSLYLNSEFGEINSPEELNRILPERAIEEL